MEAGDRPREKAMRMGFDALSDAELLAILFNTGIRNKSVVEMSEDILAYLDGHLSKLVKMTVEDICVQFKGIGPAKALTLLAAVQLGMRAAADAMKSEKRIVKSSSDIVALAKERFQWLDHEEFWVYYLSQCGEVIYEKMVGKGGLNATVVDVRVIISQALKCNAASMILIHNHPSGTLKPSMHDMAITKKVCDAAKIFDLRVLDHLIIAHTGHYSFCDEGKL